MSNYCATRLGIPERTVKGRVAGLRFTRGGGGFRKILPLVEEIAKFPASARRAQRVRFRVVWGSLSGCGTGGLSNRWSGFIMTFYRALGCLDYGCPVYMEAWSARRFFWGRGRRDRGQPADPVRRYRLPRFPEWIADIGSLARGVTYPLGAQVVFEGIHG